MGRCDQGAITVEMQAPRQVRPNQPFGFRLRIINRTEDTLRNVTVRFGPPETYQMTSSELLSIGGDSRDSSHRINKTALNLTFTNSSA